MHKMTNRSRTSDVDMEAALGIISRPAGSSAAPDPAPRASRGGLEIGVAATLPEVMHAWELVYRAYVRIGLIDENEYQIHASPYAIHPETVVVVGHTEDGTACTLSIMHDDARGLPLDEVYRRELDQLRDQGRRLLEVGLLADRRENISRSLPAIMGMMRFVFYNTLFTHTDDIICGVHPKHAAFYKRYFAFEEAGEATTHPSVKDKPVVLLRLPLKEKLALDPLPRGLASYVQDPLPAETFDRHFDFAPAAMHGSRLAQYLDVKPQARWDQWNDLASPLVPVAG